MNFNNIPQELKALNQWACFRLKWNEKEQKNNKIIISPITKKFAYCNNPYTWSDFETAKAYCQKYKFTGLTFALTNGITFIDIDHAIDKDTGEIISKEAKMLLNLIPDTFTEKSVSGSGIHILVKGSLSENALKRNDKKGLEMYDTKRFICMTGETLNEYTHLADYSDKIESLNYEFIGKRKPPLESTYSFNPCTFSDLELLEKICCSRQGEKFKRLYNGDITSYPSHSNADFALASILAWWTKDSEQIDRIFRASGLMREKWDRRIDSSTYGANLIEAALQRQSSNSYNPKTITPSAQTTYYTTGFEM